jgi:hypothetical protein
MDEMYEAGGDDATDFRDYQAASHDALQLEIRIIATRAQSNADREPSYILCVRSDSSATPIAIRRPEI